AEKTADLRVRPRIQRLERSAARSGQREQLAPRVVRRGLALDPAASVESPQHPAQITGVDPKLAAQVGGRRSGALRELIENAHLRQRQGAVEQTFLEDADLARIEA